MTFPLQLVATIAIFASVHFFFNGDYGASGVAFLVGLFFQSLATLCQMILRGDID